MTQRATIAGTKAQARRRGRRIKRILRRTCSVKLAVVFLALVLAAGFYLRLAGGPVSLQGYTSRLADALAARIGPGWSVAIRDADLDLVDGIPAIRTAELVVRNPEGAVIVRAPHATVSVEPLALFFGRVSPREIELRDLQLRAFVEPNGGLAFATSDAPSPVANAPAAALPRDASERLGVLLGAALEPVFRATSLFGDLSQASLVDARLTLVDQDGGELVSFRDVDARYTVAGNGDRDIEVQVEGRNGRWLIGGKVRPRDALRTVDLRAESVPLSDVAAALGIDAGAARSDLKLWARASVGFSGAKVVSLRTELESSAGTLALGGTRPVAVERLAAEARWTSESGLIELPRLDVRAAGSAVRLAGTLVSAPDGAWRMSLGGRDLTIAGATPEDVPVRLASADLAASVRDGAATIDRLSLKGEGVDLVLSGSSRLRPEGRDLDARLDVSASEMRGLLALWPAGAAAELRAYLKSHVPSGRIDSMAMKVAFDPAGLKAALADLPMPEGAVEGRFKASGGHLKIVDGLPPLTSVAVEGGFTGTRVTLAARSARMTMPDGRRLSLEDGSYEQADYDSRDTLARIGFRAAGPADAFASLLRSPALVEAGAPEIDPATVRGRGDVRIALTLPVRKLPIELQAMPLSVTGTLSELSVDRIVGQEKLEGGALSVSVDSQAAALKGQATLSGMPAQIELQAPRSGAPAEAIVTLVLDEGMRSRRSLPIGPALAGPVPIRMTASFGGGVRSSARIEADLSKASVDNLVPGWTKPAGRPGRLSFLVGEGDALELRDLSLESGSVQIKGSLALSSGGGLERADLSTLRLSPGDDLRALVEKAGGGYRVTLRGNNADARPLMKWAVASSQDRKGPAKDAPDLDLDLAVNILTGHDEAMTGVTARFATRGREIRALQFSGRLQKTQVEARLTRPDPGDPLVVLESGDAGATMRFLDLYSRAYGGKLSLKARVGDGVQDGIVTVEGFRLRGEPALRQLVSESAPPAAEGSSERTGPAERIDPGEVQFTKLTADFRRTSAAVDFREVVMWGSHVGFNLAGRLDTARDTMDVTGTFVPAYALNNAFSQVPIVGLFLGGGVNEGLFAIDFRVSGPTAAPQFTVNPLTAMAPGILRKFLGLMMPPGGSQPQVTGAVPERRIPIQ